MSKRVPGLIRRPKTGGGFEWHIDKGSRIMDDFVRALAQTTRKKPPDT